MTGGAAFLVGPVVDKLNVDYTATLPLLETLVETVTETTTAWFETL